jgi:hypothetical protein
MAKQTRTQMTVKERHRARKPFLARPLDAPKADNHAERRRRRKAHEALMAKQAAEKAEREKLAALEAALPGGN